MALTIEFQDQRKNYRLKVNDFGVEYKSRFASYDILQSDCNKHFLNKFKSDLNKEFKTRSISSNPKVTYLVKKDQKTIRLLKESRLGYYLFRIDRKVSQLKLKEKVHCE
jgi:hypothetical protein